MTVTTCYIINQSLLYYIAEPITVCCGQRPHQNPSQFVVTYYIPPWIKYSWSELLTVCCDQRPQRNIQPGVLTLWACCCCHRRVTSVSHRPHVRLINKNNNNTGCCCCCCCWLICRYAVLFCCFRLLVCCGQRLQQWNLWLKHTGVFKCCVLRPQRKERKLHFVPNISKWHLPCITFKVFEPQKTICT